MIFVFYLVKMEQLLPFLLKVVMDVFLLLPMLLQDCAQTYIKHGVNYYWAFLIGIYSGMRTEEICKLRVDEVQQEEDIWSRLQTESHAWRPLVSEVLTRFDAAAAADSEELA